MQRGTAQRYYLFDGQMSTRQLTDALQSVTDTYNFDAFGGLTNQTGTTQNDYLFAGEQFDANVGFYYLRARYYDPATGRFISQDAFGGNPFEPLTLHKYTYAHNDPINGRDPSGNFTLLESETTLQVMGIIGENFPTLLRAFLVYKGIDVFYRPGFEMRNFGIEMLGFCSSDQCFNAAINLIERGNRLIVVGSKMIAWADKTVQEVDAFTSLLKTGFGWYQLAQVFRNAPKGGSVSIVRLEIAARIDYLETNGMYLLQSTASIRVRMVFVKLDVWTDYSNAMVQLLKKIWEARKIPNTVKEASGLFTFDSSDLGL